MPDSLAGGTYEIILGASIEPDWSSVFDGFDISRHPDGVLLTGEVIDQPALHGVLAKARDLGISIVGVRRLPDSATQ